MTLNIRALKKSKIRYLMVFFVVLSMLFPSTVFAAAGDAPTLTPDTTASTTGKVNVTITYPSTGTILTKQFSVDSGASWMDYTGVISITDNTTIKAMYTYLNGSDTYVSKQGSLTISNITGRSAADANNGDWTNKNIQKNYTPEADLMFRVGDIDNFGYKFAASYNPFSGNSTPVHSYPWSIPTNEPAGLDRIMEVSGYYKTTSHTAQDGYTTASGTTAVSAITMNYDLTGINVTSAKIQMFVDDFQAGVKADVGSGTYYRAVDVAYIATINGVELPELSSYMNQLNQSGPIGKLITFNLPDNYLQLVRTGQLVIKIDDPNVAKYGDGYAIDFVKLLINTRAVTNTASISGKVTDVDTGVAISGAEVSACGLSTTTDSSGNYTLPKLSPGLAVIQATATGYAPGSITKDLVQNQVYTGVDIKLKKTQKPGKPVIEEDILVPTSSSVHMTITYPDDPKQKKYSDHQVGGQDVWVDYTGVFTEDQNCTIKAKGISSAGVESDIAVYDITNIDKSIPPAPVLTPNITTPTNGNVIVTATYPAVAAADKKFISVDGGATWTSYTGPVTIEHNTTVVAKCSNAVGTKSPEARLDITNINKDVPATPILTPDITEPTNKDVTVTATYPPEAVVKQISIDGGATWSLYTNPVVLDHNTLVEAKCANSVGTSSLIAKLNITNIDKSVPPTPVLKPDITEPTNGNVTVTASYDQVAVVKLISADGGLTWQTYSGGIVVEENNTTIKAKCKNAVGTESLVASYTVTNIDKSVPPAPVITPSTTEPVNHDITVTVAYQENAQDKQISIDGGKTWQAYPNAAVTITENTDVWAKYKNKLGTQSDIGKLNIANIDKKAPTADLKYYIKDKTGSLVDYNENTMTDKTVYAVVTNFSKVGSKGLPSADGETVTNKGVSGLPSKVGETVINNDSDGVTISMIRKFTKGGHELMEFEDKVGNKGSCLATVNNKLTPLADPRYDPAGPNLTKGPVVADLINFHYLIEDGATTVNEAIDAGKIQYLGDTEEKRKPTHTFTSNGQWSFNIKDDLGFTNTIVATVTWIDDKKLEAGYSLYTLDKNNQHQPYDGITPTTSDVYATIVDLNKTDSTIEVNIKEGETRAVKVSNDTIKYIGNTSDAKFVITDTVKNVLEVVPTVNRIDKTPPGGVVNNNDAKRTIVKNDTTAKGKLTITLSGVDDPGTNGDWGTTTSQNPEKVSDILLCDKYGNLLDKDEKLVKDTPGSTSVPANGHTHELDSEQSYTFYFKDQAGNVGNAPYDWKSTQLER